MPITNAEMAAVVKGAADTVAIVVTLPADVAPTRQIEANLRQSFEEAFRKAGRPCPPVIALAAGCKVEAVRQPAEPKPEADKPAA